MELTEPVRCEICKLRIADGITNGKYTCHACRIPTRDKCVTTPIVYIEEKENGV